MKQNITKGIRVGVFLLILGLVIFRAYKILAWKDTTGNYLSSTQQLYHTPENTMDVVFLGSSHCYCGIYPAYLWRDGGIAAFDMAVSGQDRASTYHALVETLKTQQPKVVFVDMYGLTFDVHAIEGNIYRNMLSMRFSRNSLELIQEYVEPEKQKDFIARWPIIHTRFWEVGKYDYIQYQPSLFGRGADYQWVTNEVTPGEPIIDEVGELEEKNRKWLERLCELSKKEGFDLVFYVAPFYITQDVQREMNAASRFAEEHGIPFIDFNILREEIGLIDSTDFVDQDHCNALGAEKVTGYLKNYLDEHYNLEDHRGDGRYACWDQDYNWFRHLEFKAKLARELTAGEVTQILDDTFELIDPSEVLVVVSVDPEAESNEEDYRKLLDELGISENTSGDETQLPKGMWILQGGEPVKVLQNDPGEEYRMDLGEMNAMRLKRSEERDPSDIMFNYDEYLDPGRKVTIVIYDLFLGEVLRCVNY